MDKHLSTLWLFVLLMMNVVSRAADSELDHSSIVEPREIADAKRWVDRDIADLSAKSVPVQPIVRGISQGWGHFQIGKSVNEFPLTLNGKVYTSGLGSHAPAVIEVLIPPGQIKFSGVCGVDDTPDARTAHKHVVFTIEADGKKVFRSGLQTADDAPAAFEIDVASSHRLLLQADSSEDYAYMPVDFVDLKLTSAAGDKRSVGEAIDFGADCGDGFSFIYDGKSSADFLHDWAFTHEALPARPDRIAQRLTWTDPKTGLQSIMDITRYTRYPVVEWVQHFRNTGKMDTPILESIRAIDVRLAAPGKMLLHYNTGDYAAADSYAPHVTELVDEKPMYFAPVGGRPTDTAWPYFNVQSDAAQRGFIFATAWPGQWSASFERLADFAGTLHVDAGQQLIRTRLYPGEDIRTPISVICFYRGSVERSQNLWRRWMLDCNTPHPYGKLPVQVHASNLGLWQSEKTETDAIKLFADHGVKLTHWWMDAGWYPCQRDTWWQVGNWVPDPARFPHGIKPVSDAAHANGEQLILWFEPERAHINSWMWTAHPQWLLTSSKVNDDRLLDLGNPDAWSWLVDHVDEQFKTQGIDLYRQDFNFEPLSFWREHDLPDRQGMTEMRHIEGYLAYWDELHRRHPDMLFDTCASGGRRLDLETLRRSVPLWRCDDSTVPEDAQAHTYGIAAWLPYYGSGVGCDTPYNLRSDMLPFFTVGMPTNPKQPMDWDLFRRETANWNLIREDLLGDYYPLLPYRYDQQSWMAWQFDRPDLGRGVIQAFRRPDCPFTSATFLLHGLDPAASYTVTDLDAPDRPHVLTGNQLAVTGVAVSISGKPGAAIVTYVKTDSRANP